jgi:hypothetical protein
MNFSKTPVLIALMTSFALVACDVKSPSAPANPQDAENYNSNAFFISSSEVQFIETVLGTSMDIPIARKINFKVCLRDSAQSQPMKLQSFVIEGAKNSQQKRTDEAGCLQWVERIDYNHIAADRFVKLSRLLKPRNSAWGVQTASFAVNPWSAKAFNLKDLPKSSFESMASEADEVELSLQGLSQRQMVTGQLAKVWVEDLRLQIEEKKLESNGVTLQFDIRTSPILRVIRDQSAVLQEPITRGEFNVSFYLIHAHQTAKNAQEVRKILARSENQKVEMQDRYLYLSTDIKLSRICTEGHLRLGIKIEPQNTPVPLKTFEGVFYVGRCNQVVGAMFSRLQNEFANDLSSNLEQYLKNTTTEEEPSSENFTQPARIEIQRLNFATKGYAEAQTMTRTRQFNVQTCLRAGLDGRATRAAAIEVTRVNGTKETLRTNNEGCLAWDDSITFEFMGQECWIEKDVRLTSPALGLDQTLKLSVNPWSKTEIFARDLRFNDSVAQQNQCVQNKNQLITTGYSFDKLKFEYQVDDFLNIKIQKRGILKLAIALKRPSLTDFDVYDISSAPAGSYLVRGVVVDQNTTHFQNLQNKILDVFEEVFHVEAQGTLVGEVALESTNLKALANTNQILLEILPLKDGAKAALAKVPAEQRLKLIQDLKLNSSHLSPMVFRGPILLANNNESGNLEPLRDPDAGDLISRAQSQFTADQRTHRQRLQRMASKAFFADQEKLQVINLNNSSESKAFVSSLVNPFSWRPDVPNRSASASNVNQLFSELKQSLSSGEFSKVVAENLCAYWFYDRLARPTEKATKGVLPAGLPHQYDLTQRCLRQVRRFGPSAFFDIEFRYFVRGVQIRNFPQEERQAIQSFAKELMINTGFALNKGYQESVTKQVSADASLSLKLPEFLMISPSLGSRISISKSWADNQGHQAAYSFASGLAGIFERLQIELETSSSEKCMSVRLQPHLYIGQRAPVLYMMSHTLSNDEKINILRQGLVVCEGMQRQRRLNFKEDFFIFNQRPQVTQGMDPNTDSSRPFFFTLRGMKDAVSFLDFLQVQYTIPGSSNGTAQIQETVEDRLIPVFLKGTQVYPGQIITVR